jgi:hypothetical protein
MTNHWTTEHVNTLAPDAASLKNGRALAVASKWQTLGQADGILWGEIKGSGSKPYQTCIEQATPSFKCSCPSRKFPCKHGLGLALVYTAQPDALNQTDFPDWVAEWVNKRTQKQTAKVAAEPVDEATLKKREKAQEKRQAARSDKVSTGVAELQTWLYDQVRQGLSQSVMDSRAWDKMAARMIDAQAPALARRLQQCAQARFSGDAWQEKLLTEVAHLHLLLAAYQRREELSPDVQADIAAYIGETSNKTELLTQTGVTDDWLIIGQAIEEQDAMRIQRTWLYGTQQQRYALLLDFAIANQTMTLRPAVGSTLNVELVFYAGSYPVRALLKQDNGALSVTPDLSAFMSIPALFQAFQSQLAQSPWLSQFPCALSAVTPVRHDEQWLLVDHDLMTLPLKITDSKGWHLLAVSGGHPINIFGEWNGETLLPLAVFTPTTVERL